MNIDEAREICRKEKQKAKARLNQKNGEGKYDASQAINAWGELIATLNRHKPTTQKQLERSKKAALQVTNFISSPAYKNSIQKKIKNISIN